MQLKIVMVVLMIVVMMMVVMVMMEMVMVKRLVRNYHGQRETISHVSRAGIVSGNRSEKDTTNKYKASCITTYIHKCINTRTRASIVKYIYRYRPSLNHV